MKRMDHGDIQLLYFEHSNHSETPLHTHPYCQLEYCLGSPIHIFNGQKHQMLSCGSIWFIPPNMPHQFLKTPKQDFLSLKFQAPQQLSLCMLKDPVISYFMELIRQLIDGETFFSPHSPEGDFLIESHLAGILNRLAEMPEQKNTSDFKSKFYTALNANGACLSIDDLAGIFQMSRAQFRYAFYKETGSGNIKQAICDHLVMLAKKELLYSDKTLSKIAEQLKFSSIYSFSRFFKTHCGISPLKYKQTAVPEEKKGKVFHFPQ